MTDCPKGIDGCKLAEFCDPSDPYCDKTVVAKSANRKRKDTLLFGSKHTPKTGDARCATGVIGGFINTHHQGVNGKSSVENAITKKNDEG